MNRQFAVMIAGTAKSGMEDYVRKSLTEMMKHSQKDKGCIIYNIHESTDASGEFMVYMVWKDEGSFDQHNQKPELQEWDWL